MSAAPRQGPTWRTWLWVASALLVIVSAGLAAGWLLERYDLSSGFDDEATHIAQVLKARPGVVVADVIAGTGKWSLDLARRVGPTGRVYATEFGEGSLPELRKNVADSGLTNVTVLESTQQDVGLAPACCDAVLVRVVYHHFEHAPVVNLTLFRALRPDGVLAIIDFDHGTAEQQSGHGIARSRVQEELTAAGFELVRAIEDWNGHAYCLLFRKPAGRSTTSPED